MWSETEVGNTPSPSILLNMEISYVNYVILMGKMHGPRKVHVVANFYFVHFK